MSATEHNSAAIVPIENGTRGETLASSALTAEAVQTQAATIGERIFTRTTGKLNAMRQDIGYLVEALGLDKDTWQGKIETKIDRLVTENPGLLSNDARVNWAAKAEAYLALTKQFGFTEVDQYTDLAAVSEALVVGLTESGSVVMFGPGTTYEGVQAVGDGRFAMTYMKGREGNKKQADGEVPPEVHVKDGATGAKVSVFRQDFAWDDAAGAYKATDWQKTNSAPSVDTVLSIDHSNIDKTRMDAQGTSRLLKVMMLARPENMEAIMGSFEGVADEINRLTGTRAIRRPQTQVSREE